MQETYITNWNSKKFTTLIIILIITQFICFMIGNLAILQPTTYQNILGTACEDDSVVNGTKSESEKWYYTKGTNGCTAVDMFTNNNNVQEKLHQVVYAIQVLSIKYDDNLDYLRQQNLLGILHIDIIYQSQIQIARLSPIVLDAKLAYRNEGDPVNSWKHYATSRIKTVLECSICDEKKHYTYDCMPILLFGLCPLYHDYYLLNIRFPRVDSAKNYNQVLNFMTDVWLTVVNQNEGSMRILIGLQTFFFPIIFITVAWYWRRVCILSKSPTLLQYMVLTMGIALLFLNMPLEYMMFYFDLPVMLHVNDIKHCIFYAVFLSFLLILVGEHLMIQHSSSLKCYWRHLSAVVIGYWSLCTYDIYKRIAQLRNPFYLTAITNIGGELALSFVTLSKILAGLYLMLLTYMIWRVFANINIENILLPSNNPARQLHYENVVWRFKFIMVTTLLCALLTLLEFIQRQIRKDWWRHDEDYQLEVNSTFYIGVYGMWNIYVVALLCLYAPLHKKMIS